MAIHPKTRHTHAYGVLLVGILFCGLCLGCVHPNMNRIPIAGNIDLRQSDIPFFLLTRTSGETDASGGKGGVLAAVWYDGTVLRSKSQQTVTPKLEKGKMQNDHMGVLLKRINDAFEGMPATGIPMHVPGNVVYVRTRAGMRAMATNLVDWAPHPVVELRNLVFSIELSNSTDVDAEPYYEEKPSGWRETMRAGA